MPNGFPSADKRAVLAEVAGHIPTLHRLQCIEMTRIEPTILLLDAIFRSTFNKPMQLVLRRNIYPEGYKFPSQDLKIHYIEASVTNRVHNASEHATIARVFLPRLVSACAATLTNLHIYDDHYHTKIDVGHSPGTTQVPDSYSHPGPKSSGIPADPSVFGGAEDQMG